MQGKWAQGIQPRNFAWIIKDRLAICERPGGYGDNHRRVRRQEEIIWMREQGFGCVISLLASTHNLHNYDEFGVPYLHRPLPPGDDPAPCLQALYPEMHGQLTDGSKVVLHGDEVGDRVAGVVGGYVRWAGMVPEGPQAISIIEPISGKQLDPFGRSLVALAAELSPDRRVACAPMPDLIEVRGLRALGLIGVNPEEQDRPQPFEIDLDLEPDLTAAGAPTRSPTRSTTGSSRSWPSASSTDEQHLLLERVAERIAEELLAADTRIEGTTVSVRKLRPPIPADLATTAVTITRRRVRDRGPSWRSVPTSATGSATCRTPWR